MRRVRRFLERLTARAAAREAEARLRLEIEEHLEMQTADNLRAGMAPDEARRQARLKFGGVEAMKETYRDERGLPLVETLWQDTRLALRRLRMAPAFTLATVLTLALGMGATTSIFTLAHAVLLKSLPVARPGELYRVGREIHCCFLGGYSQDGGFSLVSYELYRYLRDRSTGFAELAAFPANPGMIGVRRAGSGEAAHSDLGEFVSGNYFRMFGIQAYAGRVFTDEDDREGAPPVAVMSYRLWQQSYGSDPSVIGGIFHINERPFTVVGVTPPGFFGDTLRSTPPDFFVPLNMEPFIQTDTDLRKYDIHWLNLIGRIRPGAAAPSIEAEMRVGLKQWLLSHWGEMSANDRAKLSEQTLYLSPGGAGITSMRDQYEHWLAILMVVSGFVLLIVCANVANLMLVRGMERTRQTSLSLALGAGASRVVRQAFTESMLLALAGGAAGLAVAFAGTRLILHFAFPTLPGFDGVPIDASPSMPVLLFAAATSLLTGAAFAIAPAWMATRVDPIEALRGAGRSTGRAGSLPRKALVALQAAVSLVLLSASGLLTSALERMERQDLGFDAERRTVVGINPRLAGYRAAQLSALYHRIRDSVGAIPGVSSAALCLYSAQSGGGWGSGVFVDGQAAPGPKDDYFASWNRVTEGYFEASGNAIVRGRGIAAQDTAGTRKVAVINQAFARKFFAGENPIGKHFGREAGASREFEVVGVAKDARYLANELVKPIRPLYFLAEAQAEYERTNLGSLFLKDIVILTRPGASVSPAQLRQAVAKVDPALPVISIRTMGEQVASQFGQQRLIARITSFFGLLSLVLASIGLYGVTAYNAGRRVSEIGVRMALGASRADVMRLVLGGAFGLLLVGLLLGLPLSLAVGRFVASQLSGVNPYDPAVLASSAAVLGSAALAASLLPAWRASRTSPLEALREE